MGDEHSIRDGNVRNLRYRLLVAGPAHAPDIPAGSIVVELTAHDLETDARSRLIEALSLEEARELRDALASAIVEAETRAAG